MEPEFATGLPGNGATKAEKAGGMKRAAGSGKIRAAKAGNGARAARIFPAFHSMSEWPITNKNMMRTSSRDKSARIVEIRPGTGRTGSAGAEKAGGLGRAGREQSRRTQAGQMPDGKMLASKMLDGKVPDNKVPGKGRSGPLSRNKSPPNPATRQPGKRLPRQGRKRKVFSPGFWACLKRNPDSAFPNFFRSYVK
jgi:hypothetical protein